MSTTVPPSFTPISLRSVTARNRIWISPMCQYEYARKSTSPPCGYMAHWGSRAVGGAGSGWRRRPP